MKKKDTGWGHFCRSKELGGIKEDSEAKTQEAGKCWCHL
jgi:hypothetical protein